MKFLKLLLCSFLTLQLAFAQQTGGMWIPSLLEGKVAGNMQKVGMKMTAKEIYDVNQSSLKDAIVHFNGGCTGEIISNQGLILTNHHCGYGIIQSHSSVEKDYLSNGFWAKTKDEELVNKNLFVRFIIKIEDVTEQVLENTENITDPFTRKEKIGANIQKVSKNYAKESWQDVSISEFFEGNQYILFVTETYRDVRLVGAPPSSIGKFGSDTDNWVWPRHTGDFSLFRVYADKNNRPAEYSKDNVPYTPKHFLPISMSGISEDDFTMVFGFPGRTQEYLPAVAVQQIVTSLNPAKIKVRDASLTIMDKYMRVDPKIKIQYAAKYASIANYWKKWIGETQGLQKSNAVQIKLNFEKILTQKIQQANKTEYAKILPQFDELYEKYGPYALAYDYFVEVMFSNSTLLNHVFKLYQSEKLFEAKGESVFLERKENMLKSVPGFFKNFDITVEQEVATALIEIYMKNVPEKFLPTQVILGKKPVVLADAIYKSNFVSQEKYTAILQGADAKKIIQNLNKDPLYAYVKAIGAKFYDEILPTYEVLDAEIEALQTKYMKVILEMNPDTMLFPDANSTLRITYGKVKGYQPRDAVKYEPISYLDGVIEKYVPGDYEFDVPQKLLDLYQSKDYGVYGENGKMPVCFIATNHTTGGNSGSPAIDAHGNLIGLNFDRVWEGTMSDIHYDPAICRNIMVDIRYVLFIIDKYAGAKHLVDEMKLVYPKK